MLKILVIGFIVLTACGQAAAPAGAQAPALPPPTAAPVAVTGTASMADFLAIQPGMTLADVERTIGSPGTLVSQTDMAGYSSAIYSWDGDTVLATVMVMFENGRVVNKTEFGLAH
jgi:hypothetical protein